MASFPVHLSVAMTVSGIGATTLLVSGMATPPDVVLYFMLGTLGGVLPDMDSKHSTPLRVGFEVFSVLGASIVMFRLGTHLSVLELCCLWLGTFVALRYGLFYAFTSLTVHRGVFHTIPAAVLLCFLTAIVVHHLDGSTPLASWIAGIFAGCGYLVHLILDEVYSVDLAGAQMKRSFGTAFKILAPRSPFASLLLYVTLIAVWQWTPDTRSFVNTVTNGHLWQRIETRLLPHDGWFHHLHLN